MGRWGNVNIEEMKRLRDAIKELRDDEQIYIDAIKRLAGESLRAVKKKTPVGVYDDGRVGGTLRRGWKLGEVRKRGDVYEVEIYNNVKYAPYVEYGHRTRGGTGFVEGRFMMKLGLEEVENRSAQILRNVIETRIRELIGND